MKRALFILLAACSLLAATVGLQSPLVAAAPKDEVCAGIGSVDGSVGCTGGPSIKNVISDIIEIFSVVIGITAVIMIMVGGFKYVTANGDSGNISSAKNTILYAVIGLVVAGMAQGIVKFVLESAK